MIEAHFDPESGIVTVYEGRPEFKALERAARRAGFKPARVREYLPYRMLEVEAAANAVYHWAAEQIVARRLAGELRNDPVEYAHALRHETQSLRHRAHETADARVPGSRGLQRRRARGRGRAGRGADAAEGLITLPTRATGHARS